MPGLGELAGLTCAMSWAVTTLLVRHEARRANVLMLNAVAASTAGGLMVVLLLALIGLGAYSIAFGARVWVGVGFLLGSTVFSLGMGDNLFFLALQRIGVGRAMPLAMSEPLLATLLAVLFLGERVTPGLLLGLVLIPPGLYLVTLPARGRIVDPKADTRALRLGVAMALGASVAWALSAVTLRPGLDQVDLLTASAIRTCAGAGLVWLVAKRSRRWLPQTEAGRPRLWVALLAGVFSGASTLFFAFSVLHAGAARAATLAATSPLYAVPLSALLLGEQVTGRMMVGTLMAVAGVVLVVGF